MNKLIGLVLSLLLLGIVLFVTAKTPRNPQSFSFIGSEYFDLAIHPTREGYWAYVIILMTGRKELVELAQCESSLNSFANGDKRKGIFKAKGLFQFWESSFLAFAKRYGIQNPNWSNTYQQIELADKMIRDGYAHLWTCSKKIGLK